MAYLEMARAAVEHSSRVRPESAVLELRDTIWTKPVIVTGRMQISIALSESDYDEIAFEIYSEENQQESVRCQGRAVWSGRPARGRVDVDQLRKQMQQGRLDESSVYAAFGQMGLHYGPAHQSIAALYLGENQLFAELRLPPCVKTTQDEYILHPSVMDGALQASIRLSGHLVPCLPSALATMRIMSGCAGEMLAWVRRSPIDARQLDIDLIDRDGNVCVEMVGLELSGIDLSEMPLPTAATAKAPEQSWDGKSYLCKWEQQPDLQQERPVAHRNVVVVRSAAFFEFETAIREYYDQEDCRVTLITLAETTGQISANEWSCGISDQDGFQQCLQTAARIDAIYFMVQGERPTNPISLKTFAESREINEIQFLRLVKYMQQCRDREAKIDFYVLTLDVHSLNDGGNAFLGTGVTGLGYSLAQGNSKYRVRNLDLSSEDLQSQAGRMNAFAAIVAEPPSSRGEVFKLKSGRRHRQTFVRLKWDTTSPPAMRRKGTYVIVGGAGTVGGIISRNLIEKYDANVVWIGRSAESSEKVRRSLESFRGPGACGPLYFEADVTDLDSMQNAVRLIKEQGIRIDGAIFAAMLLGSDHPLDQIAEGEFRGIFDIKAQGSWVFHAALKNEPLDFMCYFSSRQAYALIGASKYPAYASGVTFSDAFVRSLQDTSPFPVGIINWGIWKSSINQATEAQTTGSLDALADDEGFECFERFVTELRQRRIHQSLCVGESRVLESLMNWDRDDFMVFTRE
ncbi:MAG: SDR family NAD(P)-dependent oxidoreductase, partial [Acidobacteriota bacterium]